jgi:hypothetical protein
MKISIDIKRIYVQQFCNIILTEAPYNKKNDVRTSARAISNSTNKNSQLVTEHMPFPSPAGPLI